MPSSHSSSSHSSSSFSSSSSSSHSSFSSSSHSYSSHSSSSYDRDDGHIPSKVVKELVMPAPRARTNQPGGFNGSVSSSSLIRGVNHDYVYFPDIWTDNTGARYHKGYYDEKGQHYKQIIIKDGDSYETRAECSFCGTQIKLKWTRGAMPSCPNCGAALKELVDQSIIEEKLKPKYKTVRVPLSAADDGYFVNGQHISKSKVDIDNTFLSGGKRTYHEEKRPFDRSVLIFPGVVTGIFIIIILSFCFGTRDNGRKTSSTSVRSIEEQIEYYSTYTPPAETTPKPTPVPGYFFKFIAKEDFPDTIYVDAIGRECKWHASGNYYDPVTDCYFWLNDTVAPPIWQYWYEGISSDFGDYGWMEYDFNERTWYIEASAGNWIVLPDKYDQSKLWHMKNADDGRYLGMDRVYVKALGRYCNFIEEESNYYDPETKCHFYYDTYTAEGAWVYWFEDFRSEEGIGWIKYNKKDEHWYVENQTRWFRLENGIYDFDKYTWHM